LILSTNTSKIAGFEFVKETVIPIIERFEIDITDKMRTFTEHIALQIAIALLKRNTIYHWRRSLQRFSYRANLISFTQKIIIPENKIRI
jgi:anhydro-N-acetylmuramic acid kinase